MIEIEVQNETHQTQERIRFAAVPRIGEGLRLREPDGMWASYDVLDVWYQKAEYGDIWMPYVHVCMTPEESVGGDLTGHVDASVPVEPTYAEPRQAVAPEAVVDEDEAHDLSGEDAFASLAGEAEPFKI
ncbi:MAG: hypothetical protein AAF697_05845 [Pseudomonadota bacterium]